VAAPTRIQVRDIGGVEPHGWVAASVAPGEYVDAQSYDELLDAIGALIEFSHGGHDFVLSSPPVETARALEALHTRYSFETSPAPIDRADVTREVVGVPSPSGAGGDPSPKLDDLAEGGR
jgi:hypothetical protein